MHALILLAGKLGESEKKASVVVHKSVDVCTKISAKEIVTVWFVLYSCFRQKSSHRFRKIQEKPKNDQGYPDGDLCRSV